MNNSNAIDALLRKAAGTAPTHTVSAEDVHSRIISYGKLQKRLRRYIGFGVFPASIAIGLFSMWIMSLPASWIAAAFTANAILILAFLILAKLIAR